MNLKFDNVWALILGGSSGFGLATAKELSNAGMNICVVHRDRQGAMPRIQAEFDKIKASGVKFKAFNLNALTTEGRNTVLEELPQILQGGKVRLLLHSIAFGSLKLLAPQPAQNIPSTGAALAAKLNLSEASVKQAFDEIFKNGDVRFSSMVDAPKYESELLLNEESLAETIYAMGTSLYSWTKDVFERRLFDADARVIGLTSEGNEIAWRGYAAVSAAKAALESMSRSIAREFAAFGIRCNIVQPGITDTPAMRMIPGSAQLSANAIQKNPFGRLTTCEDVAKVIALLSTDGAAWINGTIIRVDGGERISG